MRKAASAMAAMTSQNLKGPKTPNPNSRRLAIAMPIRAIDAVFFVFIAIFSENEIFIYSTLS